MIDAAEASALLNSCSSQCRDLARWVSLTTQVPRWLLRSARLRYEPRMNPQVEAELWFGELVEAAGSSSITLYPEVARALREELVQPPNGRERAQRAKALLVGRDRETIPQLVRLEEAFIWNAVVDQPYDRAIEESLRSVLRAILDDRDRAGLKRWAAGLRLRIPEIAHQPTAVVLETVARLSLSGTAASITPSLLDTLPPEHKTILAQFASQSVPVGIHANGSAVTIHQPPREGNDIIEVPATEPIALFLEREVEGVGPTPLALSSRTHPTSVTRIAEMPFTLTSVVGDRYRITSLKAAIDGLLPSIGRFLVEVLDDSQDVLGFGILAGSHTILTTGTVLSRGKSIATTYFVRFTHLNDGLRTALRRPVLDPYKPGSDVPVALDLASDAPHGAGSAFMSQRPSFEAAVLVRRPRGGSDVEFAMFNQTPPPSALEQGIALRASRLTSPDVMTEYWGSPVIDPSDGSILGLCVGGSSAGLRCVPWSALTLEGGTTVDMVVGGLTDPFESIELSVTAENVAEQSGETESASAGAFSFDIFVSYALLDDRSPNHGDGWVSIFVNTLKLRLAQLRGREVTIWRDDKLAGANALTPAIADAIGRSALFIAVLSPAYAESSWCQKELQMFIDAAKRSGGVTVGGRSRVIKVWKLPTSMQFDEPALTETRGYQFFQVVDGTIPRELEFGLSDSTDTRQEFLNRINDLAHDLVSGLERLRREPSASKMGEASQPE